MKKQLAMVTAFFGLTACASQHTMVWHSSVSAPFTLRLLIPDVPPTLPLFEYDTEAIVTFHRDESGFENIPSGAAMDYRAKNGTRYIHLRFYAPERFLEILGELPPESDTLQTEVHWKVDDSSGTHVWYVHCVRE